MLLFSSLRRCDFTSTSRPLCKRWWSFDGIDFEGLAPRQYVRDLKYSASSLNFLWQHSSRKTLRDSTRLSHRSLALLAIVLKIFWTASSRSPLTMCISETYTKKGEMNSVDDWTMSPVDTAMLVQSLPFTFYSIPLRNHIHRDKIGMRDATIYLQGWCFILKD